MNEFRKKVIRRLFFTIWSVITVVVIIVVAFMVHGIVKENSDLINTFVNTL
jgi:hypothetical protein